MTIDDDSSIYVGGLPYNITEESLRRVFNLYGAIVAVKIVNDHGTRGKCYGFVTFRNPRSVVDAISDMDGKTIDGRVVRVNAVTTRGGRSNSGRERFRQNAVGWDRGRERDRDSYRERYSDRSREWDRSWDTDDDRGRGYEDARDHDRARDGFVEREHRRGGDGENDLLEEGRKGDWEWEGGRDLEKVQDRELDGTTGDQKIVDKETGRHARKQNGSTHDDRCGREILSDSSDDYNVEVKDELDRSVRRQDELKKEISLLEEEVKDQQQHVLDLQKKAKKLEDALINERKLSSQKRMQLSKLQKYFLQVKDYTEELKRCEQEFESLIDSPMIEGDTSDDVGARDGVLTNCNT